MQIIKFRPSSIWLRSLLVKYLYHEDIAKLLNKYIIYGIKTKLSSKPSIIKINNKIDDPIDRIIIKKYNSIMPILFTENDDFNDVINNITSDEENEDELIIYNFYKNICKRILHILHALLYLNNKGLLPNNNNSIFYDKNKMRNIARYLIEFNNIGMNDIKSNSYIKEFNLIVDQLNLNCSITDNVKQMHLNNFEKLNLF